MTLYRKAEPSEIDIDHEAWVSPDGDCYLCFWHRHSISAQQIAKELKLESSQVMLDDIETGWIEDVYDYCAWDDELLKRGWVSVGHDGIYYQSKVSQCALDTIFDIYIQIQKDSEFDNSRIRKSMKRFFDRMKGKRDE